MNIAIEMHEGPIKQVLGMVLSTIVDCQMSGADEAKLVITEDPRKTLPLLKQGKRVFQFLAGERDSAATGLLTAPAFKDRFKIFVAVEGMAKDQDYPGFVQMLAEIGKIEKEIENENSGS